MPAKPAEVAVWRERACELEDEVQYLRDELLQARAQASDDVLMACGGAEDVRLRVEIDDPHDKCSTRLIPLAQLLHECSRKRERPPILTSTERLRKAKMTTGAYKARAGDRQATIDVLSAKLVSIRSMLEETKEQHKTELEETEKQHKVNLAQVTSELQTMDQLLAAEKKRASNIAAWRKIERKQALKERVQQLEWKDAAHDKELAQRARCAATWRDKRSNMQRALKRASARALRDRLRADASAADAKATAVDNEALHVELGQSVKIAAQRQGDHANAAFTFNTILRDIKVRQQSLNSGASNVRPVTQIYSEHIAADGRDLKLESGSVASVLRWEKRADVVCMLLEGRRLRQALLDEPLTRLHIYVDLSPDAARSSNAAWASSMPLSRTSAPDGDAPPPFAEGRLSGEPLSSSATVRLAPTAAPSPLRCGGVSSHPCSLRSGRSTPLPATASCACSSSTARRWASCSTPTSASPPSSASMCPCRCSTASRTSPQTQVARSTRLVV